MFNNQGPCPPDGFRYVDPEDGWTCHAWAWNDWIPLQKAHLTANNRPIPDDLEAQMEDQLCKTLPPGWCTYETNGPRPHVNLGWDDIIGGVRTFAAWMVGGCQYVDQAEADRRALVCSKCYLNVNVSGCSNCHKIVAEVTKDRHSKYDFALKACAACRCLLKAKVWFPIETLDKSGTDQQLFPDFCWMKKDGENYRG